MIQIKFDSDWEHASECSKNPNLNMRKLPIPDFYIKTDNTFGGIEDDTVSDDVFSDMIIYLKTNCSGRDFDIDVLANRNERVVTITDLYGNYLCQFHKCTSEKKVKVYNALHKRLKYTSYDDDWGDLTYRRLFRNIAAIFWSVWEHVNDVKPTTDDDDALTERDNIIRSLKSEINGLKLKSGNESNIHEMAELRHKLSQKSEEYDILDAKNKSTEKLNLELVQEINSLDAKLKQKPPPTENITVTIDRDIENGYVNKDNVIAWAFDENTDEYGSPKYIPCIGKIEKCNFKFISLFGCAFSLLMFELFVASPLSELSSPVKLGIYSGLFAIMSLGLHYFALEICSGSYETRRKEAKKNAKKKKEQKEYEKMLKEKESLKKELVNLRLSKDTEKLGKRINRLPDTLPLSIKVCPRCDHVAFSGVPFCPDCGYDFQKF